MASLSSTSNEATKSNRSDPSRIYNIGQTSLARLRPEKLDDVTIKKQISIIQEVCGEIDPDLIALIHHECDYNIQATIARIKVGDFEEGGWQTAKSNNKKKNLTSNHVADPMLNGHAPNDGERTLFQHASPPSSVRGTQETATASAGRQRQDPHQNSLPPRNNAARRGNEPGRNYSIPANARYPPRNYSNITKPLPIQANVSDMVSSSKEREEITLIASSPSTDEYEFTAGTTHSLTFDNSLKAPAAVVTKRPTRSSIPQQPVSMHPTVQFSTAAIDIQFGDVQWNDSAPMTNTPSNSSTLAKSLEDQQSDVQSTLLSSYSNHQATNAMDREFLETTTRLSTSSISSLVTSHPLPNNAAVLPAEGTSHLSDHLTDSLQQHAPLQIASSSSSLTETVRLPPTSTPNASEYTSPIAQTNQPFIPNILQASLSNESNGSNGNPSSAFTPYTASGVFQPIAGEYLQATANWSQQPSNYKPLPKSAVIPPGNYPPQTAYPIPPQLPQQYIVGAYPYHPSTLYPVITTSVDPWSTAGYEPYPGYSPANYIPAYTAQQQYHTAPVQSAKYDQYPYDKELPIHYGHTANPSLPPKDALMASKLSATAAAFPQGAPLSATSPATAYYINPILYTVPTYYTAAQDRSMSYASNENRDSRTGAPYGGNHNRNHYQQQRTHQNSTWHSQQ